MRFLICLLPALVLDARAQAVPDARELLAQAGAAIFAARTVRLAGTSVLVAEGTGSREVIETSFSLAFVRGGRGKREVRKSGNLQLQLFDGSKLWNYNSASNTYSSMPASAPPDNGEIRVLDYGRNISNIASAALDSDEQLPFGGQQVLCYVVRAAYRGAAGNPNARNVSRRVWITRDRNLILRDEWNIEMPMVVGVVKGRQTVNYSTVETGVPLADDLFAFQPPAGSHPAPPLQIDPTISVPSNLTYGDPLARPPVTGGGIGSPSSTGVGSLSPGGGRSAAVPLTKVEPEYSEEARAAGLQGSVLLKLDVTAEGAVENVRVRRGLGLGLDERAVSAVKQWKYTPRRVNGVPAKSTEFAALPFRLNRNPSWHVEGFALAVTLGMTPPQAPVKIAKPVLSRYDHPDDNLCTTKGGYAAFTLQIGTNGAPGEIRVTQSSGEAIAQAVARAAQNWEFEPGSANGDRVPGMATVLLGCRDSAVSAEATPVGPTYRVGAGVSAPLMLFKVEPEYSEEARKAKYQGNVLISLIVEATGEPSNIRVIRSLGLGLDEQAIEAVEQWRFKPAMKEGKAVRMDATISVSFKLL